MPLTSHFTSTRSLLLIQPVPQPPPKATMPARQLQHQLWAHHHRLHQQAFHQLICLSHHQNYVQIEITEGAITASNQNLMVTQQQSQTGSDKSKPVNKNQWFKFVASVINQL